MSKKIIKGILLCSSLFLLSGCALKNPFAVEPVGGAKIDRPVVQAEVDEGEVTNQQMKLFFSKFLNVDHDTMLVLNQRPKEVDDEYWRVYRAYEAKVTDILGEYMSTSAQSKLKRQYLHDDFHFPRFIELNDYMITGITNISDAKITSKEIKADSTIYEVQVIGMADVIDLEWANMKYSWDDAKGYYVQNIFLEKGVYVEDEPGLDRIRVAMNYFVEVPEGDKFTVTTVKEKMGLHLGIDEKGNMKNNNFIKRLSFLNAVIVKEEAVIHKFLDKFMKENYNFYSYYRKAHETDYDTFQVVLDRDLGLGDVVVLDAGSYKQQFEPSIIPLKDDMDSLYFDVIEDVKITPHVSSSAKLSTYQVVVSAEVTLTNGDIIPYEYTYLFILDKELRISSVRLMTQQEVGANGGGKKEVVVEDTQETQEPLDQAQTTE